MRWETSWSATTWPAGPVDLPARPAPLLHRRGDRAGAPVPSTRAPGGVGVGVPLAGGGGPSGVHRSGHRSLRRPAALGLRTLIHGSRGSGGSAGSVSVLTVAWPRARAEVGLCDPRLQELAVRLGEGAGPLDG